MGNFTVFIIAVFVLFSECLIEVKKPPNNLAQRLIQKKIVISQNI